MGGIGQYRRESVNRLRGGRHKDKQDGGQIPPYMKKTTASLVGLAVDLV